MMKVGELLPYRFLWVVSWATDPPATNKRIINKWFFIAVEYADKINIFFLPQKFCSMLLGG
ncbi:MAG: hypothetical protein U5L09_20940 [Bacteroidales bacterium]|nr:hypothetical protein [Bacteroidales bacterium]